MKSKHDIITIGNVEYHATDFEQTLRNNEQVRSCSVGLCLAQHALNSDLVLFVEVNSGFSAAEAGSLDNLLKKIIIKEHQVIVSKVILVSKYGLPRCAAGHVDRQRTINLFRRNALKLLSSEAPDISESSTSHKLQSFKKRVQTNFQALVREKSVSENTELSLESIRGEVAGILKISPSTIDQQTDLVNYGLDSVRTMGLVNQWRKRGFEVKFSQFIEQPSLEQWWQILSASNKADLRRASSTQKTDKQDAFPLTSVQHAYWIGRNDEQVLGGVGCHFYVEFDGHNIQSCRLERAINQVVKRHGMLRARFFDNDTQEIMPVGHYRRLVVNDYRDLSKEQLDRELDKQRNQLSHCRLKVEDGEVFSIQLSLLPEEQCRIHFNVDLLVADVLSIQILLHDLALSYASPELEQEPIDYDFRSYLHQLKERRSEAYAKAKSYWMKKMHTIPGAPKLPLAILPEHVSKTSFSRRDYWMSPSDWQSLSNRAKEIGVTLPMALATVFSEVLAFWSEQPRFSLNIPLFDREPIHPDTDKIIADFTNLILVTFDASKTNIFAENAQQFQAQFRQNIAHSEFSGVEVLREVNRINQNTMVCAPVVFTSAIGMGDLVADNVINTLGEPRFMLSQTPQVWLDHQVIEHRGGLLFNWDAVEELFPEGMLDDMFDSFINILQWLCLNANWNQVLPLKLPQSQNITRRSVNQTSGPQTKQLLQSAFLLHAKNNPQKVALRWGDECTRTYGELAARVIHIANLLRKKDIQCGELIGISLPKGPAQIEAVLAILLAGCGYVPIGIELPELRRKKILDNAQVRIVIALDPEKFECSSHPRGGPEVLTLSSEEDYQAIAHRSELNTLIEKELLRSDDVQPAETLAYVIYTSGSTGEPKGVETTHSAVVNTINDINSRYNISTNDRVLAISSLDFDLSVYDIFGPLSAGGSIVLIEEAARLDPQRWKTLTEIHGVTVWNSVPALLDMLLITTNDSPLTKSLRLVLLSGDWIGLDLPERLSKVTDQCQLISLGGATEAAIWSNAFEVNDISENWRSIPYGYPLRNQQFRVVDYRGRDCPDWVGGELWIGGAGVAQGYRNSPEITATQFLQDKDGTRWYKTGDIGRYWSDGTLEFLGRADQQVKIRGHRIELGEIETMLMKHPDISQAYALVIGEQTKHLAVIVIPSMQHQSKRDEWLAWLKERLPVYMQPKQLLEISHVTLNHNNKADLKTLKCMLEEQNKVDPQVFQPPRNDVEILLAQVWTECLDVRDIGRNQSFFELGGDSLIATRVITKLGQYGVDGAKLAKLFEFPVLRDYAEWLSIGNIQQLPATLENDLANRAQPFPLTEVQQAYWIGRSEGFTLGAVSCHFYTEYEGIDLDLGRLELALNVLIERHEMLRVIIGESGYQQILDCVPQYKIATNEVGNCSPEFALKEMRDSMSAQVLDPSTWPVFDVRAVNYGNSCTRLGFSFDNMILDASSMMIVYKELSELYEDLNASLPSVDVSFRDYITQVTPDDRELKAAQLYWNRRMLDLPPAPQLPLIKDPANVHKPIFTRREASLEEQHWLCICERAKKNNLTPSTVLATAFSEVLATWSSCDEFTVNFTLFDRRQVHPNINNILGDFTSLLLVRYKSESKSWIDKAKCLQLQVSQDLEHSAVSAVEVLRQLARQQGGEVFMPVVYTSTIGMGEGVSYAIENSFGKKVWGISQTPQVWLDHQVVEHEGGLLLNWDVVDELFPDNMIDTMFDAYIRLLNWLSEDESNWHRTLPSLLPDEQVKVRSAINDTQSPIDDGLLIDGFFRIAEESPQTPALFWGDDNSMTYGELSQRARTIAAKLLSLGLEKGDSVAISLPKGPAQIVAVLGVLSCSALYVPIGVDQPENRRLKIINNAQAKIVIADCLPGPGKEWPPDIYCFIYNESLFDLRSNVRSDEIPITKASPDDLAYVIYTSGSTGEPKGVEVSHRSAVNTIADINMRYKVSGGDRVLAISALDFDLSVYDIFGPLMVGAGVVIVEEESRREPARWLTLLDRWNVSIWNTVPALMDMLLASAGNNTLPANLRLALLSGDWISLDIPDRLRKATVECQLVALGGATEASIWSNAYEVYDIPHYWRSIPYGYPLANQQFRVVNSQGADCPDWVTGELWIGGKGVAQGYRNDQALTQKSFLEIDGTRWYRTGDLGRYWSDGTLEFLGRTDSQVKIRGHRIELGEVESALLLHSGVRQAVAIAEGKNPSLFAFIVTSDKGPDEKGISRFLSSSLPYYALPSRIFILDAIPLTVNGKIDRKALRKLADESTFIDINKRPEGPIEIAIAQIWSHHLEVDSINSNDNFVALGGDSILAARVVNALCSRFGIELTLRQLFTYPTILELSQVISEVIQISNFENLEEDVI